MTSTPDQLRAARRERGLSQAAAAAAIGVHQTAWAAWEVGHHSPNPQSRQALHDTLGIDVAPSTRHQTRDVILDTLTDGAWRTRREIAAAIGRAPGTVRPHLRRLVAEGRLERSAHGGYTWHYRLC